MHISAKAEYAVRAMLVMAAAEDGRAIKGETIARSQAMPVKFVENTLIELRRTGLVASRRGAAGGFMLGRPAELITLAAVIRAVDGPLAQVRGERPESLSYEGPAQHLQRVWIAVRTNLRSVLENVSLADVVEGRLDREILRLSDGHDAWEPH